MEQSVLHQFVSVLKTLVLIVLIVLAYVSTCCLLTHTPRYVSI
jgi:hypothetical protein